MKVASVAKNRAWCLKQMSPHYVQYSHVFKVAMLHLWQKCCCNCDIFAWFMALSKKLVCNSQLWQMIFIVISYRDIRIFNLKRLVFLFEKGSESRHYWFSSAQYRGNVEIVIVNGWWIIDKQSGICKKSINLKPTHAVNIVKPSLFSIRRRDRSKPKKVDDVGMTNEQKFVISATVCIAIYLLAKL